jgi:mRNA interferase RelE/StbE
MAYTIDTSPAARRQLARLPRDVQPRVSAAIDSLADNPRPPGCLKLHGRGDQYRIRVGDYRIIYEIQDDILIVLVVEVGPRDSIY